MIARVRVLVHRRERVAKGASRTGESGILALRSKMLISPANGTVTGKETWIKLLVQGCRRLVKTIRLGVNRVQYLFPMGKVIPIQLSCTISNQCCIKL